MPEVSERAFEEADVADGHQLARGAAVRLCSSWAEAPALTFCTSFAGCSLASTGCRQGCT